MRNLEVQKQKEEKRRIQEAEIVQRNQQLRQDQEASRAQRLASRQQIRQRAVEEASATKGARQENQTIIEQKRNEDLERKANNSQRIRNELRAAEEKRRQWEA